MAAEELVQFNIAREHDVLEKTRLSANFPPQIPRELIWDRIWASELWGRPLITRATTRSDTL
jgi:hypothetical protein